MPTEVLSVATALPAHPLDARVALSELRRFWPHLDRLAETDAELGTRYMAEPLDELLMPRGLSDVGTAYLAHAKSLAGTAARKALADAGLRGADVDMVISVSCTGYLVPSLDVHLAPQLGFRPDIIRVPITELGCSGGAAALALAHRHLLAFPDHVVLVMAVELPSLNFQAGDRSLDNLTACLVFGDGAGAAVLTARPRGQAVRLRVHRVASHLVPSTHHLLGFDLRDGGFHVVLDRRLSRALSREVRPAVKGFLADSGLRSLDFVAAHAGGPRILDALEAALDLPAEALETSRRVFADVGNTSSASIFFALERVIDELPERPAEGLGIALGPGVTIELMHLSSVPSEKKGQEAWPVAESLAVGV